MHIYQFSPDSTRSFDVYSNFTKFNDKNPTDIILKNISEEKGNLENPNCIVNRINYKNSQNSVDLFKTVLFSKKHLEQLIGTKNGKDWDNEIIVFIPWIFTDENGIEKSTLIAYESRDTKKDKKEMPVEKFFSLINFENKIYTN